MANCSYMLLLGAFIFMAQQPIETSGSKILLAMTCRANSLSQHIALSTITETLVERGHEVILLAGKNKITKGLSPNAVTGKIFYNSPYSTEDNEALMKFAAQFMLKASQASLFEVMGLLHQNKNIMTEGCLHLFNDTKTLERLKHEKFDMILTFPVVGCDALLSEYLGVPFCIISPLRRLPIFTEDHYGIPIPSSYVPFSVFTTFTDKMSFKERVLNNILRFVVHPALEWYLTRPIIQLKKELNLRPDLSLSQLIGTAKLWLCHSNFALEYAQPIAPNWIAVGGLTAKPGAPLPDDIEAFVQGSGKHGIIVFTLGSAVSSLMDDEKNAAIAQVFSELPQRVFWRLKGKKPTNVGNNTYISDWLPQNDLLAHPKTRMMIAHGGASGVYESVSHGVPMLVMPMGGDQMGNAARVEAKGIGIVFDKNKLTEESFRKAVHEILDNEKYAKNAKKASGIINDHLAPPTEVAAFWIEHVIKFGGDHLRSRATEMNWIQLNSIDVMAFLLAVFLVFIMTIRWIVVRCCCRMCRGSRGKPKKD